MARQIAQNLGIKFDFGNPKSSTGRTDSKGQPCRNVGGLMDIDQQNVLKWTSCSAEDFKAFYKDEKAIKIGPNVL